MTDIEKLRNIGTIAHIDAGKTTTTERILYYSGREHKMGDVDDGTTTPDWMPLEREKGITIVSAALTCNWRDHTIHIIDTPGHIDFTAEVERSLRVLDGAVGVFCAVGGVEAQSETVWRQADRYKVPRLAFINKMDRIGADFDRVIEALRTRLNATPIVLTMPWGQESDFRGVIDVLNRKALIFDEKSKGKEIFKHKVPREFIPKAEAYRAKLIDTLADLDDEIIVKYSEGTLTDDDIKRAIRKATLQNKVIPVLAGAALRYKGVQCVLDAVVDYLPAPSDMPPVKGFHPKTNKEITHTFDDKDLCALAFKTVFTKHGDIIYVRIYSGTMREGMQFYNPTKDKVERIARLWRIYANQLLKCESAGAGDIVGVVGLKYTVTGDTLCKKNRPIVLERMKFPETVISKAIEPKVTADKDRLVEALTILSRDDPTFAYSQDVETGQTLISGMGELHLEIIHHRLQTEHKLDANVGKPRVSYRETVEDSAEGEYCYERQFANKEHYAYVKVRIEPSQSSLVQIVDDISHEGIPKHFHAAVEEGIRSAISSGELAGYPITNVKITVLALEARAGYSSEIAFNKASFESVKKAMRIAGYAMLEPIMRLEIQTPVNYLGDILSNLNARRAEIQEMDLQGEIQTIRAKVPLAEMFGYSNELRTISQGRATYSMEPLQYSRVPEEVQKKLTEFSE